jgi:peptidoglycan/xylan/chitin deacetylase (PgdA/CDA1 family)
MKITGGDYISQCLLYLTSDNFVANFATINLQQPVADPGVRWFKDGEWKWITVNLASTMATNNGSITGSPNFAAIDAVRVRLVSTSGNSATVRLQAVQVIERKAFAANGVVCFTYDDSYRSQSTIAKVHLDKYGYPGTAYTICQNVNDGNAGNTTWLTTQMLKDMRNYSRWEIGLHSWDLSAHSRAHAGHTSSQGTVYGSNPLTTRELDLDIDRNLQWLIDNGLTDGFVGHCQPQGRFNAASQAVLTRRTAYSRAMTANSNGCETIPVADPWAVRSYTLDNTTTYANLQTIIDGISTHGGLAVFTCHDIVASPATSTQFSTTIHGQLVDYVAGKANMRVMTLGDVMRAHSAQG